MGKTSIEWCDSTWNPIRGTKGRWYCTHVSEGCRNCYAERLNVRWGGPEYKPGADTFRLDEKVLQQPLHWKKPRRIFVCDMTDLFHEDIPEWMIDAVTTTMCEHGEGTDGSHHTYQILTKRPLRMREYAMSREVGELENIWLGVSVEDQATADERIPLLYDTPAAVRFISYEPALGPVDFGKWFFGDKRPYDTPLSRLHWLIIGGESGPKARPFDLTWARSAITQCRAAKIPVFMKQVGSKPTGSGRPWFDHGMLSHAKGGDPKEWPEDLRVREWPHSDIVQAGR